MTSKAFANTRRATIDPSRATPSASHGDPWPFDAPERAWVPARASAAGDGMTTHITVVDRDRNLVSLTSTLGMTFGSGVVIEGAGICLNNGTCWFDPEPGSVTSIGPGKRILSAASPVLVSRGGRPWLALGSPGGRRVMSAVYQCLVNAIDFGLGMQAAVSAPRVHSEGPDTLISNRFPGEVIDGLRSLGHAVTVCEDDLGGGQFARPSGIMVDDRSGEVRGGVFQFTPATAVGVCRGLTSSCPRATTRDHCTCAANLSTRYCCVEPVPVPSRTPTLPPASKESVAISVCATVVHVVPVDVSVAEQSLSVSLLPVASALIRKNVLTAGWGVPALTRMVSNPFMILEMRSWLDPPICRYSR
jgi:Gamma-glutamyltranspeptidase